MEDAAKFVVALFASLFILGFIFGTLILSMDSGNEIFAIASAIVLGSALIAAALYFRPPPPT